MTTTTTDGLLRYIPGIFLRVRRRVPRIDHKLTEFDLGGTACQRGVWDVTVCYTDSLKNEKRGLRTYIHDRHAQVSKFNIEINNKGYGTCRDSSLALKNIFSSSSVMSALQDLPSPVEKHYYANYVRRKIYHERNNKKIPRTMKQLAS